MAAKSSKPQSSSLIMADQKIEKFINYIMQDGKKSTARRVFHDTMVEIRNAGHTNAKSVFVAALENAAPTIMVKSKRVGGSVYQVPVEVKATKKVFFAAKWILEAARKKKGKPMCKKLSEEMLAAYNNQGFAVKRKEEVHRMADANKAFAYMAKYVK